MVKNQVILDNGKAAQSSMALYWKVAREKKKHPQPKVQKPIDEQKMLDQKVQNGFNKWKIHKEKIISKAYNKPVKQMSASESIAKKIQEQQRKLQEELIQRQLNKKRKIHIPGFESKDQLKKSLKMEQNVNEVSQQNNILRLPEGYNNLTQQDIIQMLRVNKSKKQLAEKSKRSIEVKQSITVHKDLPQDFNSLMGDELLKDLQFQKQQEQELQKAKQLAPFFKSDILNQLQRGNVAVIVPTKEKQFIQPPQVQQKFNIASNLSVSNGQEKAKTGFVPRVLKK